MDSSNIDLILTDALSKLKKEYPEMDFFLFLQPFAKTMFSHLGAEDKRRMENEAISAATQVFENYVKQKS